MFTSVIGERVDVCFFFQAEDGIRDLVRSRGLGDVYKRQTNGTARLPGREPGLERHKRPRGRRHLCPCAGLRLSLIHI